MVTVGAPGVQGVSVIGMHGIGVNTPMAAAVAEATSGFAGLMHMPNVGMFSIGTKSMMVAAGIPPAVTVPGVGMKEAGAAPNVHVIIAPPTTRLIG
jgi:hypothetical protein